MKLYVYDHCPYCVKARAIFGLKHLAVEIAVPLNDDDATPMRLIGKKMVPILEKPDGAHMPESMDIVAFVDGLDGKPVLEGQGGNTTLHAWLEDIGTVANPLCMPRWIEAAEAKPPAPFLQEFATDLSRRYFVKKKEAYIGPFAAHKANSPALIAHANAALAKLEPLIHSPQAVHGNLSEDDIHLFARLRSLSIVQGLIYPPKVDAYRKEMSKGMNVPLHDAIAV